MVCQGAMEPVKKWRRGRVPGSSATLPRGTSVNGRSSPLRGRAEPQRGQKDRYPGTDDWYVLICSAPRIHRKSSGAVVPKVANALP